MSKKGKLCQENEICSMDWDYLQEHDVVYDNPFGTHAQTLGDGEHVLSLPVERNVLKKPRRTKEYDAFRTKIP